MRLVSSEPGDHAWEHRVDFAVMTNSKSQWSLIKVLFLTQSPMQIPPRGASGVQVFCLRMPPFQDITAVGKGDHEGCI